jgi:hypothetical protein
MNQTRFPFLYGISIGSKFRLTDKSTRFRCGLNRLITSASCLLIMNSLCLAQVTVQVGSASAIAGEPGSTNISLVTTSGNAPASLEWTLTYPSSVLSGLSFVASPAVAAAGKSISCTTVVTGTECILWGLDTTAIPNGVIATANFNVSASATGSLAIGITGASASSATGMALGTNGLGTALDVVQLSTLVCSPQTLLTPGTASCTVTLTAAPTSAVALPLGDIVSAAQVTMPTSITVPEGATSATFNVQVAAVTSPTTLTVTASDPSTFNITLQPPSNSTFTPIRVRAGGAAYTDPSGNVWSADNDFSGGHTYVTNHAISNTSTPTLYQTERYGNVEYQFAVPNGNHTVTLKFAEIYWNRPGERVFNVTINGVTVLSNFDIFSQAGAEFKALDESFPVSVSAGTITIQFTTVVNNAKISAIEIQ